VAHPIDLREPADAVSRAARELASDASPVFLRNHALRTYAFAALFANLDGVPYDPTFLYVGSVLHDLGLTERFASPRCFENDSAEAAYEFALRSGWSEDASHRLGLAIRLHMQPRVVPEDDGPGYLLSEATSCDVRGHRLDELPSDAVAEVLERYPRAGFKMGFTELFARQAREKPGCLADIYMRAGFAAKVAAATFED
jgi:hypothetical protein